jgi:hypothetical protein
MDFKKYKFTGKNIFPPALVLHQSLELALYLGPRRDAMGEWMENDVVDPRLLKLVNTYACALKK